MNAGKRKRAPTQPKRATLDPFGFWPNSASRIRGLGGQAVDPDPVYVFHTSYMEVGSGIVTATLRFRGLQAELGELTIRVNGTPPGAGARAETLRTWTMQLNQITESDGIVEVSFQASAGSRYALLGSIYGDTDARATGFEIEVVLTPEADDSDQRAAARKSIFGRRMFRRANRMLDRTPATFTDPFSQTATAAQIADPSFVRWAGLLGEEPRIDRTLWAQTFVLNTLDRYAMLRPGARGLGLGVGASRLPAMMAARGCTIVATDPGPAPDHGKPLERLRIPGACADDVFDRQVSHRFIDPGRIDVDLAGFDFCWSIGAVQDLGTIPAGHALVLDAVRSLSFGGLSVHVFDFNLSSNLDTVEEGEPVLFRRQDVERIAVDLVSRGHFVAQFKYDVGRGVSDEGVAETEAEANAHFKFRRDGYVAVPFGFITRRGDR